MRILIISGAFYPNISPRSFRTTELVKEFMRKGHDVTVYIPKTDYDYSEFKNRWPASINFYERILGKNRFVGISIFDRIILHYIDWLLAYPSLRNIKKVKDALHEEAGYDLLVTIAVPHYIHWAVGKLYAHGHRIAKTWVADCGDAFMLCNTMRHRPPFYFKPLETRWCRECDYISVPLETEKDNYYSEFRHKIKVIPQGFDFSEVLPLENFKGNETLTFAYSGSFIPKIRDPRPLLDYLCQKQDRNFKFVIYTSSIRLISSYKNMLREKLEIRNYVPRLELLKYLKTCDFLINIDNGEAKGRPSKLIDYALTGRPILNLTSSNLDVQKIEAFLNRDYSQKYVVDNIEQFDIRNVAQQFIGLVK